jgi:spore maturation protein CgeB
MKFVLFYHSLISDWNHGNAHFLRGVVSELQERGNDVTVMEPADGWSLQNLKQEARSEAALQGYHAAYPQLQSTFYDLATLDLEEVLRDADVVIVHEWNPHELVKLIGEHRARHDYKLLFHDTHHRAVTERQSMAAYDLQHYDGVLAFGNVIRDLYLSEGWCKRAWTWHEAADTRVFRPLARKQFEGDLVWVGNWGDEERTRELHEFLLEPVRALGLKAKVYGVRYPQHALDALQKAGIEYGGWLPNHEAPRVFARYKVTVHVPRRPYVAALPGIPTIRVFEALACGIPLVSAPWHDTEELFSPGLDFWSAQDGMEMQDHLEVLVSEEDARRELCEHGRETIAARHTCAHRVDELMKILLFQLDETVDADNIEDTDELKHL